MNDYPWPAQRILADVPPFDWSLDGGGRHLIFSLLQSRPHALLLEIGSFMGGSALQFLRYSESVRTVLCDPWTYHLSLYATALQQHQWAQEAYGVQNLRLYASLLSRYSPYLLAQNNLYAYRNRCVLIKQPVPRAYWICIAAGLKPDIVYIDAMKQRHEFWDAHHAFPDAILCGDDWSWRRPGSSLYPVREFVHELALERNALVFADRMTFVICEERHRLDLDPAFQYSVD